MAGRFEAIVGIGRILALKNMLILVKKHNNFLLYNGKGSKSPSMRNRF
jgi:hypothetical protein